MILAATKGRSRLLGRFATFLGACWQAVRSRPLGRFATLLGAWWQAAAARRHLEPPWRQGRNPIKNDFGGHTRPKPGFATLLGAWWQAAAARTHTFGACPTAGSKPGKKMILAATKGRSRLLGRFATSWGLLAGCRCTEEFEACPSAGSKPDKK